MKYSTVNNPIVGCLMTGLVVGLLLIAGGCAAPTGLNPYVYLEQINSVDHTPFFRETYSALNAVGLSVALTEEQIAEFERQDGTSGSAPGTSDLDDLLSQFGY